MKQQDRINQMRDLVRKMCLERGLSIVPYGKAWHIFGRDVDLLTVDLACIGEVDLRPFSACVKARG